MKDAKQQRLEAVNQAFKEDGYYNLEKILRMYRQRGIEVTKEEREESLKKYPNI